MSMRGAALLIGVGLLAACREPAEAASAPIDFTVVSAAEARAEVEALAAEGPLVLNLWATWCQPCMEELPAFAELARERPDWRFLGLSCDWTAPSADREIAEGVARARAAWRERELPFGSLYLDEGDLDPLIEAFGLETGVLPQTLLYRPGAPAEVHEGALDAAELRAWLGPAEDGA